MTPRLDELALLEVGTRAEWRAWLSQNAATSPGVWLAIGKKGGTRTLLTYSDAVEEALCFGWIDSTAKKLDAQRYKQLLTRRKPQSTWSRSNKERADRLIEEGAMTPAGLSAIEIAKANGSWALLDDVEALIVPEDLAVALEAVHGAAEGFASLGTSQRKLALYWIASAKKEKTRAVRIAATVAAAASGRPPR